MYDFNFLFDVHGFEVTVECRYEADEQGEEYTLVNAYLDGFEVLGWIEAFGLEDAAYDAAEDAVHEEYELREADARLGESDGEYAPFDDNFDSYCGGGYDDW